MHSKRSKHIRSDGAHKGNADLQIRAFPRELRIDCKRAALDQGQTLREWFIAVARRSVEEGRG